MEDALFQWLGTAGFRIEHAGKVILIDPYLTRNERARPAQSLRPADMSDADLIFLSHGHFDHIFDVPAIVEASGAGVYCSKVASETLGRMGVDRSNINELAGGESLDFGTFAVEVTPSKHIRFDARLVLSTLPGALRDGRSLRALRHMPAGPVLVSSFVFGELRVTHMGSLGLSPEKALALGLAKPRADILMPPLQGHTDICRRAALLTAALRPRAVVPQHFDDFFPPVSRMIDLEPFRREVGELLPSCVYYEPEMNRKFTAADVLDGD